jgi:NAD(P)-dependent dehydrogenase (short-subunit alcohol dehydrogenase family)
MPAANLAKGCSALVVGGSRGIGLELVRQLLERGMRVTATVRSPSDGLAALDGGSALRVIENLDVTVDQSVAAAISKLAELSGGSVFGGYFILFLLGGWGFCLAVLW